MKNDSLDRYNRGERINQCKNCGATFTHLSGCNRVLCDVCLAKHIRKEKWSNRVYIGKNYGPPVVSLVVTAALFGMPAWVFLGATLVLMLAIYGVVITIAGFGAKGWTRQSRRTTKL